VARPVALVDLTPTLAALFSLPRPERTDGVDLTPAMLGGDPPPRPLFTQRHQGVAAIEGGYKYIVTFSPARREELFALHTDPAERRDLSTAEPAKVETMRHLLAAFVGEKAADVGLESAAGTLSEERRRQLRALGYLGGPDAPP
jgi:arylsulfatase A-like enzyme